ncbi:MAG: benzoate-CoA ligase family protein [Betaproteobacteria bacterium]
MTYTAHVDTFARDHLPPLNEWPELIFTLPELHYPARLNCAVELLDRQVQAGHGAAIAIMGADGTVWSYAELLERVNRITYVLREDLGLLPGNRVLLRGANSPMFAACWLAVVKAGLIAVGTMPMLRAKELVDIISRAEVVAALCDAPLLDELLMAQAQMPVLESIVKFHDESPAGLEARMRASPTRGIAAPTAADDTCMIAFTSGTTGKPKGTMHFHRDVMAAADCFPRSTLRAEATDRFIGSPPLAFTFGLGGLLLFPLRMGASTVLLEKPTPDALLRGIEQHRATVLVTAPTAYRAIALMLQGGGVAADLSSLRKCVSAGEALPVATRLLWKETTGIEIIDGIGSTELLHIFISHTDTAAKAGATGKPIPGYVARVVDEAGNPLPAGKVGRLAVKGPTGCRYLADPRQSEYVQDGWNFTGDAYLVDDDGYFVYQARTDDMIISSGYNIAGPEVEDALLLHPAVAEAGVVGLPDADRGQIVTAFVVLKPGQEATAEMAKTLQDFVKQTIAPYKYPRAIRFILALPRTETGKVQRFRLRQMEGPA